jgi:hypothetical protein
LIRARVLPNQVGDTVAVHVRDRCHLVTAPPGRE